MIFALKTMYLLLLLHSYEIVFPFYMEAQLLSIHHDIYPIVLGTWQEADS